MVVATRPALRTLVLLVAGLGSGAHPDAHADAPPRALEMFLEVRVNGETMPPTLVMTRTDGQVSVRRSQLALWRIVLPASKDAPAGAEAFVALDALKNTVYTIDQTSQTLVIDTAPSTFASTVIGNTPRHNAVPDAAPLGGFFNYNLTAQSVDRQTSGGGLFEAVVFGPFGTFGNSALARAEPRVAAMRLDSTWTIDRPSQAATWRVGDAISRAGSWSQPVRFGGVQYSTNFAVQPGFNSQAVPGLGGVAALPSTIDLYINDALRLRTNVPAGPFDIPQLPVITGAGEVRLVVRDVLGRQQTITAPYYASSQLLQKGLRDFSYEVGAVRDRYGIASDDYGQGVAIVTERRGLSDALTGEVHAELSRTRQAIGVGAVALWPAAGVFTASVAGSDSAPVDAAPGAPHRGGLLSIGFQRRAEQISWGGDWTSASQGFVSLDRATTSAEPTTMRDASSAGSVVSDPRHQARTYASYASRGHGSLGIDYTYRSFPDRPSTGLLGGNYGMSTAAGYLSIAVLRDLRAGQTFASITFSRALSSEVNGSVGLTSQSGGSPISTWQAQRSLPAGDGYGYRVAAMSGQRPRADGSLQVQNDHGSLAFDMSQGRGAADWRVGATGGVAMIGHDVFASRTISDSFSIVDAGGYANVRVYADNQQVALTGADGTAIVPRLLAYQTTPIRIEQADLPLDAVVGALDVAATPWFRSGTALRFAVRRSRGALLTALLEDGAPVPAGATARVAGTERDQPVADHGEVYLTGLSSKTRVVLEWAARRCVMEVDLPETADPLPRLGTTVCREVHR